MVKHVGEVTDYQFQALHDAEKDSHIVRTFEFKPISKLNENHRNEEFQKIIKIERTHAKEKSFKISPIVEEHRGLRDQEEYEYEMRVRSEVEKRVREIQEEAYRAGFDEGVAAGREEIFDEMRNVVDQKLDNFSEMVHAVLRTQDDMMSKQKQEIYVLIKNLTKWIILRELKEDGKYVERLLEKILLEIQARTNFLIQVNENDFSDMPEVLEHIQKKLGELKNVRIEIDNQIKSQGMIVESENGIINATMEEQFKNLDKLFEDVITEAV
jgi:flagellar assembly protein FliH